VEKRLASVLVLLPLAGCAGAGSPIRVVAPPSLAGGQIVPGDLPDLALFCPLPSVGGAACVDVDVVSSQRACAVRYQTEGWHRSKAAALAQGLAQVDAPLATATVKKDWHDGSKTQPGSEWDPLRGEGLLFPLTEEGKAKFGDTMVVALSETDKRPYLARRDDIYVLVVPDYRERETRELTVCGPRCPTYGSPNPAPEMVTRKGAVLPPGAKFGGVVKLPVDTLMISEKVATSGDAQDCPAPPP